jgi:hypothetical protein
MTLSTQQIKKDIQHNDTLQGEVPFMPCVVYAEFHELALYAESCYAECHYAECRYDECRGANC